MGSRELFDRWEKGREEALRGDNDKTKITKN
jgi:hypothetical protein